MHGSAFERFVAPRLLDNTMRSKKLDIRQKMLVALISLLVIFLEVQGIDTGGTEDLDAQLIWTMDSGDRRKLFQTECSLSENVVDKFYDEGNGTWNVTNALLEEIDEDLQILIDCARSGSTIFIEAGASLRVKKTLEIEKSLSIIGGDDKGSDDFPTFSCPDGDQIFVIKNAKDVVLGYLHFESCDSDDGSPIELDDAEVTMKNCIFKGNHAIEGGSISVLDASTLRIEESIFENNTAVVGGGAIFVESSAVLEAFDTTFLQNTIQAVSRIGKGGAVFAKNEQNFVKVTFSRCHFEGNDAEHGGGIYLFGLYESVFRDCTFINNHAGQDGGAVLVTRSESDVFNASARYGNCIVFNSSFEGNEAEFGGAIGFLPGITGNLTSSTFKQNNATNGGAIYLFNDTTVNSNGCVFSSNSAEENGGAVYIRCIAAFSFLLSDSFPSDPPFLQMSEGSCIKNKARYGSCIAMVNETKLAIHDAKIEENEALLKGEGAGIYANRVRSIDLRGVNFENNVAFSGGGIFINSSLIDEYDTLFSISKTYVSIENCNFVSNRARGGDGGAIIAIEVVDVRIDSCNFISNQANGNGGGMSLLSSAYDSNDIIHYLTNSVFSDRRNINKGTGRSELEFSSTINRPPEVAGIIPRMTVTLLSVVFSKNEGNFGGSLAAQYGCYVGAKDVRFEDNLAQNIATAYILNSIFYCDECVFSNNIAGNSAGGLSVKESPADSTGVSFAEGFLTNALFRNNSCKNHGGAIRVDGLNAFLFIETSTIFERNTARGGGAVSYELAGILEIKDAKFIDNRALSTGGAIAMVFVHSRENAAHIMNVSFIGNTAFDGGAIHAAFNANPADEGLLEVRYEGSLVGPFLKLTNISIFEGEASNNGGAILLKAVPTFFENLTMSENYAESKGGGLYMTDGSIVKMVRSSVINNTATDGGGVMVEKLTMLHCNECIFDDNVAKSRGGGVCLSVAYNDIRPYGHLFDGCSFRGNKGNEGGGLHLGFPPSEEISDPESLGYVVLRGTKFVRNEAEVAGGAIMTANPNRIVFRCSFALQNEELNSRNIAGRYVSKKSVNEAMTLSKGDACVTWRNNFVEPGGYGPLRAGYVSFARASPSIRNGASHQGPIILRREYRRSPSFLSIFITLFDEFDQFPAEPMMDHTDLVVRIRSEEASDFSGRLESRFQRGKALLAVRGRPGNFTLHLTFSDERIKSIPVDIVIMQCSAGWFSTLGGQNCQNCGIGSYNFDPNATSCKECPSEGTCDSWGIKPKKGFWIPFPCYEDLKECLTMTACDFRERKEQLDEFFSKTAASCELPDNDLATFRKIQCRKGNTGLLCGSCDEHYGIRGLFCRKCYPFGVVLMLFAVTILWFVCIIFIGIKGNLGSLVPSSGDNNQNGTDTVDIPQSKRLLEQRLRELLSAKQSTKGNSYLQLADVEMPSSRNPSFDQFGNPIESTAGASSSNSRLKERFDELTRPKESTSNAPREVNPETINHPGQNTSRQISEKMRTKCYIAETFKLFINFSQICAMALSINVEWTGIVRKILLLLDFLGVMSGESASSLECLFSTSSRIPRTINREILALSVPFILLFIFTLYSFIATRRENNICLRRVVLSLVVILYVSYIGHTRKMIRILYCIDIRDGTNPNDLFVNKYWTGDTAVKCFTGSHAYLVYLFVLPLFTMMSITFPLVSAIFLIRQKLRNTLHTPQNKEMFGFMFRGYRDECVFWDSLIMFRKALLALVVGFGYPLGSTLQGCIALVILLVSINLQTYMSPFRDEFSQLNQLEVFSLCIAAFTFIVGIVLNEGRIPKGVQISLSVIVVAIIVVFVFCVLVHSLLLTIKLFRFELKGANIDVNDQESVRSILVKWIQYKFPMTLRGKLGANIANGN